MDLAVATISGASAAIAVAIIVYLVHHSAMGKADALIATKDQLADARARVSMLDGKLLAATSSADAWKDKAQEQEARANAIADDLLDLASQLPVSGARERVLSRWSKAGSGSTTTSGTIHVQVPSGPTTPGSDELLKPGE